MDAFLAPDALPVWGLRCLLGVCLGGWLLSLARVVGMKVRGRWALRVSAPAGVPDTLVSVIVPARNEAGNLEACVSAVAAQDHPALEIVVLDDGSSDETPRILEALQHVHPNLITVSGSGDPPEGWLGKPWALQRAQESASGEWLLFLDADVRLHPAAVSRSLGYAVEHELDMLSGFGSLTLKSFWERVLQPVIVGMILAANDLGAVNDSDSSSKNLANGQFLFFRRASYDEIGGHAAVAANVLDDVGLAETVRSAGKKYHVLFMRELFTCRMYSSFSEIWSGWTKNLFAGMEYSWRNVLVACVAVFVISLLGPLLFVGGVLGFVEAEWALWGFAIFLAIQMVRFATDWIFEQPTIYGLTHVPASLALIPLILNSAVQTSWGRVHWKGRELDFSTRRTPVQSSEE